VKPFIGDATLSSRQVNVGGETADEISKSAPIKWKFTTATFWLHSLLPAFGATMTPDTLGNSIADTSRHWRRQLTALHPLD